MYATPSIVDNLSSLGVCEHGKCRKACEWCPQTRRGAARAGGDQVQGGEEKQQEDEKEKGEDGVKKREPRKGGKVRKSSEEFVPTKAVTGMQDVYHLPDETNTLKCSKCGEEKKASWYLCKEGEPKKLIRPNQKHHRDNGTYMPEQGQLTVVDGSVVCRTTRPSKAETRKARRGGQRARGGPTRQEGEGERQRKRGK